MNEACLKAKWLELILRCIVGAVFIYASFHKIISPDQFAKIIYGYGLFPGASINMIAIFLPFIEFVTGLFLVAGIFPRSAAVIANLLLLLFIVAISVNLLRGHEFDCGCFSFGKDQSRSAAAELLVRDVVFLAAGVYLFFYKGKRVVCPLVEKIQLNV